MRFPFLSVFVDNFRAWFENYYEDRLKLSDEVKAKPDQGAGRFTADRQPEKSRRFRSAHAADLASLQAISRMGPAWDSQNLVMEMDGVFNGIELLFWCHFKLHSRDALD
jgi:hypothetical protein